jgi:hypothetical protein
VPPGRAKRPGIVVLTLPLYRKYRIFEPVFHFFRRGGGGEAGKHSRKPAGRQTQTGAGQKGQKKTQNEKERKRTGMHPADGIVGTRPGSPESCASVRSSTGNIGRYKSLL